MKNITTMKKLLTLLALVLCTLCSMASNKIYYTSTDGNVVTPYNPNVFGANIVSNTYENGQGVITFNGEVTKIGDNAFLECDLTSILIPESVTELGSCAFSDCVNLKSITIPNSVTTIGDQVCYNCSNLISVTLSNSIEEVPGSAFQNCKKLQSITIPNSVKKISLGVFDGCTSLTSISIGKSVVFFLPFLSECPNLKEIYCYAETVPFVAEPRYDWDTDISNSILYVPASALNDYKTHPDWCHAASFVPMYENNSKLLDDFVMLLLNGETISSNLQRVFYECADVMSNANTEELIQCKMDAICKPKLISAWAADKKALVEAAKKGVSNDCVDEVCAEVLAEIDAAAAAYNIGAIRQAATSGIAAVTTARILYKHLEQGITPVTPLGAGMRMRVTTKSDKVYEFKTSDLKTTEYYRATE